MIDFRIKGTNLPVIPVGTIYKCRSFGSNVYKSFATECVFYSYGYKEIEGTIYIEAESKEYTGGVYFMIKESDIIRLAKEQGMIKDEVMEKEIIGYKLKEDCKQYVKAICRIEGYQGFGESIRYCQPIYMIEGNLDRSKSFDKLKEAEVLDLWFDPIYKDKFQVGDWIINGLCEEPEAFKITSINNKYYCIEDDDPEILGFSKENPGLRLATPKEIENLKYPNITINGYKGEFFNNYVKFGCAVIDSKLFCALYSNYNVSFSKLYPDTNKQLESVTIGKGTFTKKQIKEIAEYYNAKISK